jgi:hypothetical protein
MDLNLVIYKKMNLILNTLQNNATRYSVDFFLKDFLNFPVIWIISSNLFETMLITFKMPVFQYGVIKQSF